jgi:hypothetical protein
LFVGHFSFRIIDSHHLSYPLFHFFAHPTTLQFSIFR